MRLEHFEAAVDFVPVHDIPPRGQIIGAAIVVLQIVSVFPNVIAHDGEHSLRNWIVLIGGADDLELTVRFANQPCPATAELLRPSIIELRLKILKAAE